MDRINTEADLLTPTQKGDKTLVHGTDRNHGHIFEYICESMGMEVNILPPVVL